MLGRPSQPDTLDLIECQAFLGPVIELGGAGALVRGHRLCVLERTSILQIRSDPGRAESMAANRGLDAGGGGATAHHAPSVGLIHRLIGQRGSFPPLGGAEQPALALFGNAGSRDVGVQCLGQRVMTRDDVLLAAFFAQAQFPSGTARAQILDSHSQRRGNAREAVGQRCDPRTVSDGIASMSRRHSPPSSTGVLPVFTTWVGPRTDEAGLAGMTWPTTSQSNSMRIAASSCLTLGAAAAPCSRST